MELPVQISFRDMDSSEALEADIRERAAKLDQFFDKITSCRVMVEASHKRHHKGNLFHVRIELGVPGKEIVVSRDPQDAHSHEDPYITVRDAFDAAQRQLEEYARRQRGEVKSH